MATRRKVFFRILPKDEAIAAYNSIPAHLLCKGISTDVEGVLQDFYEDKECRKGFCVLCGKNVNIISEHCKQNVHRILNEEQKLAVYTVGRAFYSRKPGVVHSEDFLPVTTERELRNMDAFRAVLRNHNIPTTDFPEKFWKNHQTAAVPGRGYGPERKKTEEYTPHSEHEAASEEEDNEEGDDEDEAEERDEENEEEEEETLSTSPAASSSVKTPRSPPRKRKATWLLPKDATGGAKKSSPSENPSTSRVSSGSACIPDSPLPIVSLVSEMMNPRLWTINEVSNWVRTITGSDEVARCFASEEIDGSALYLLTFADLRESMKQKIGPAKKILDAVNVLKERFP